MDLGEGLAQHRVPHQPSREVARRRAGSIDGRPLHFPEHDRFDDGLRQQGAGRQHRFGHHARFRNSGLLVPRAQPTTVLRRDFSDANHSGAHLERSPTGLLAWVGAGPTSHRIGTIPVCALDSARGRRARGRHGELQRPPRLNRVIWSIATDFNTAVTRFLSGETDFFEALRRENIPDVAKHPELRTKQYRGLTYIFAQFNLRDPVNHSRPHPIFGNRDLRRALTMATDRVTLVRSVYDSLAIPALGPTVRAYPTTDPHLAQTPFDLARARQLLDSLGWRDANGDGIRERNGRPLQFSLIVPGTSKPRVSLAVLVQEQLRQAGVKVDVEQLDFPVLIERERKRAFDAAIGQWNTDPSPGSVRGSLGTGGSRGSSGHKYSALWKSNFRGH